MGRIVPHHVQPVGGDAVSAPVKTREVSLREMLEAMARQSDDQPFRWYQTSSVARDGSIQADETLVVTMAQARRDLGISRESK